MTSTMQLPSLPDTIGYYTLAPGRLATLVSYLERKAPFDPAPHAAWPRGLTFERLGSADTDRYRHLFRTVGEPWLWTSRLSTTEAALRAILDDPATEAYAACLGGADCGLLELDFTSQEKAELRYFALVPERTGQGLGRALMTKAFERASSREAGRLWLHTCHFDAPNAIGFYQKAGFALTGLGIELFDDPRITGLAPRDSAPHVPLAEPAADRSEATR